MKSEIIYFYIYLDCLWKQFILFCGWLRKNVKNSFFRFIFGSVDFFFFFKFYISFFEKRHLYAWEVVVSTASIFYVYHLFCAIILIDWMKYHLRLTQEASFVLTSCLRILQDFWIVDRLLWNSKYFNESQRWRRSNFKYALAEYSLKDFYLINLIDLNNSFPNPEFESSLKMLEYKTSSVNIWMTLKIYFG